MPEVDLVFPRAFVEFVNPDDDTEVLRCDLTWLTSNYQCIFGNGCRGIYKESPDVGCCALGAHFADKKDEKRVAEYVGMLDETLWQFRPDKERVKKSDWTDVDDDGERKTMVVEYDGQSACIFHNRPDFDGPHGCSLHAFALKQGMHPLETKPDVCWQLPIRRTFRTVKRQDGTQYTEITIGEYDRRGWGPGGHDLDWYCTGNTEAHIAQDPVFVSYEPELVELMGRDAYDELAEHCRHHMKSRSALALHPADPRR